MGIWTENPYVPGVSYLYEMSNKDCEWAKASESNKKFTWAAWKRFQIKHGRISHENLKKDNYLDYDKQETWGGSYAPSAMPIVRCFHHQDPAFWDTLEKEDANDNVFNVSWALNAIRNRPSWEFGQPSWTAPVP